VSDAVPLPQSFIDDMITHALRENPRECCGVIARFPSGDYKLYRASNAFRTVDSLLHEHGDLQVRYEDRVSEPITGATARWRFYIPEYELLHIFRSIEDDDGQLLVIYHSHTFSEARPSPTDLGIARNVRGPDPWPYWVLVSLEHAQPGVRAWQIVDGDQEGEVSAEEIPIQVIPEPPGSSRVRLLTTVKEAPLTS
jgi:proteasome lid subunit RPN8/RPN11